MNSFYIAVIRHNFSFINRPLIRYKNLTHEQAITLFIDLRATGQFKKIVIFDRNIDGIVAEFQKIEVIEK